MIKRAVDTARPITLMIMSVASIATMIIKGILPIPIHFCLPDISFYIINKNNYNQMYCFALLILKRKGIGRNWSYHQL